MAHTNLGKAAGELLTAAEVNKLWAVDGSGNLVASGVDMALDGATGLNWDSANKRLGIGVAPGSMTATGLEILDKGVGQVIIKETGNIPGRIIINANRTASDANIGLLAGYWNGTEVARLDFRSGTDTGNKDDGYMSFYVSEGGVLSEAMRIAQDGNVGVGTSSPGETLDVAGNIEVSSTIKSSNGTSLTLEGASGGAVIINAGGATERYRVTTGGAIQAPSGAGVVFNVNAGTEAVRITSAGNVGIGTASPGSNTLNVSGPDQIQLHLDRPSSTAGDVVVNLASDVGGVNSNKLRIYADGDVENSNNSYGALSDRDLKENITDATDKLNDLLNVQIRNFNFKNLPEFKQIGVIAQELELVFPGLVKTNEDGLKSVKYSVFVPMLIKAIQELAAKVEALEAAVLN